MEVSAELAIKKPKRLTSVVWNHFEKVRKADICYAVCLHCNKKLSGSSNSGTTHLRNHLMRCLKRSNYDVSQLLTAKRKKKDTPLPIASICYDEGQRSDEYVKPTIVKLVDTEQKKDEVFNLRSGRFDQERSQGDLARMIILHGYPLAMAEHVGFKIFVKNLQPLFEFVPSTSVELSCMEIYAREKQKVYEMMNRLHGRINLAVEMWSSLENVWYMFLVAHYIDEDWKLRKRILNCVTLDPSHTEDMLSEVIMKCIMEWDIDCKLFAMTFDECPIDDNIVLKIRDQISRNRPDGQWFGVWSASHVLNSIVQDVVEALREVIQKVRASVRYVKTSQLIHGKFTEIVRQVGINGQKNLVLDSSAHWNSTYFMLETALGYKSAFSLLKEQDEGYTLTLTDQEWGWASSVASYLKLFVEITNVLSKNKSPTANVYFPEICDVHIQLIEWCKIPDDFLSSVASNMKAKFYCYWSKCSLALAIAAILDPRFKMKLVEYYYSQIYGSTALDHIKEVLNGIKELFNVYYLSSTMDQTSAFPGNSLPSTSTDSRDSLRGFDKFLHESSQNQNAVSDLEKYLEEPVFPRNCDFNILNWWKVHTPRYPILSMMARDVLGTPMSTIAPDSAFIVGDRVLDKYLTSLNPETLQALVCTRDWLRMESEGHNAASARPVFVD